MANSETKGLALEAGKIEQVIGRNILLAADR
jgi:hypothetical protein